MLGGELLEQEKDDMHATEHEGEVKHEESILRSSGQR
jgi:hypothetical protein